MGQSTEQEVIELIRKCAELDWAKASVRYLRVVTREGDVNEDRSSSPPYISFRFSNETVELTTKIIDAVEKYKGKLDWVVVCHDRAPLPGRNWTIFPKAVADISALAREERIGSSEYARQHLPNLGPIAHEDLKGLLNHLRGSLANGRDGNI